MTMRERMARALHQAMAEHMFQDIKPLEQMEPGWRIGLDAAVDAALDALMEGPTPEMIKASKVYFGVAEDDHVYGFRAMIKAAKNS